MTDVSFDVDALLGLAIDEALDEAPACEVPKYAVPFVIECDQAAAWHSVCPTCGLRIAWCQVHYDRWHRGIAAAGGHYAVACPGPELGGCGVMADAGAYRWERIG